MRRVVMFVEDECHEGFLQALLERLSEVENCRVKIIARSARGGFGRALQELAQFIRDIERNAASPPDLLIVATDSNCVGKGKRSKDVTDAIGNYAMPVIQAIPDPHIERWLLQDSKAFKKVFGQGCKAPDQKCEKDRYKKIVTL